MLDTQRETQFNALVIKTFADKETWRVYQREFSKHFSADIQQSTLRKLRMLNNAQSVQDLPSPPGNRLEKLKGKREGQCSTSINDQWLVCFVWHKNDAYQVEITDDH